MFNIKNINKHTTCIHPLGKIFVHFILRWSAFELRPLCRKVHRLTLNDLDMFKVKIPTCMPHNPRSVSLYDEPFLSYALFFGKVYRMTPNDLDMVKVKNANMHVTYPNPAPPQPARPKFSSVWLYDEPFLSYALFSEKVNQTTPK